MIKKITSVIAAAALAFSLFNMSGDAVAQQQSVPRYYRAYVDAMKNAGWAALIPASSDYMPGYVFRWVRTGNGGNRRWVARTVCSNAFLTPPRVTVSSLPNAHEFRENGFNASLSLSPVVLPGELSANIGAQLSRVRRVQLTFGELRQYEVAEANQFDEATETVIERRLNPACVRNLRGLALQRGRFRDRVELVMRATVPQSFNYTLHAEGGANITLGASIPNVATGAVGWKYARISDQSFAVVRDPNATSPEVVIAADTIVLQSVEDVSAVSGVTRGGMRYRQPTADEMELLSVPRQ